MPGPRVLWKYVLPHRMSMVIFWVIQLFIYYIRGDFDDGLSWHFTKSNTNSKQTWEGFVRGDWPQNDGVVLVMKRHYPSQRVFLNPSLARAMMIWFRGYRTVLVLTNHCDARAPSNSSLGRFLQASVRTMTPHLQQAASGDVWWRLCRQNGGENYGIISGWRICTIDSCRIGTQDWVKV